MRILPASLLLLAACAPQPDRVASAPAPVTIAMDRNSWGRPVAQWTIDPAGNGSYTVPEPDAFKPERMATRSFVVGAEGYARLRALLAPAEARAGQQLACSERITDQYYGTVRWGAASLGYDMGCRDAGTRVTLDRITAAERQVADWAATGRLLETRKVETP